MFYYRLNNQLLICVSSQDNLEPVSSDYAASYDGIVYALTSINPEKSKRSFAVTSKTNLFIDKESLSLLKRCDSNNSKIPEWLSSKIDRREVMSVNTQYPNWHQLINCGTKKTQNIIHVVGLGDVGGTLVTGLRLLGGDCISKIGIYDRDNNKAKRWEYETGQILDVNPLKSHPEVCTLNEDELFNCDVFVFCVSVGVPAVGTENVDLRLVQFKGNSTIVGHYAKLARENNFKGIFAVVSDPVDLLCKTAFDESNKNSDGNLDFKGLSPEQIRGYGLGVMNARAVYYAQKDSSLKHYLTEGRAFGPHGEGLIIADSIINYNEELSQLLTEKTKNANLDVRATGFKPYIAPALSSGSLSLIATVKGEWHYSSVFLGGTFMGLFNRHTDTGIETETYTLPENLYNKLECTYNYLDNIYEKSK